MHCLLFAAGMGQQNFQTILIISTNPLTKQIMFLAAQCRYQELFILSHVDDDANSQKQLKKIVKEYRGASKASVPATVEEMKSMISHIKSRLPIVHAICNCVWQLGNVKCSPIFWV